ncbi:MAG: UvrD-helicase domain-containing protein, partial [Clostridia bacterium]|nr:UvrD-helicase domain-containing protein [Clostridia bacterium]
MRDVNELIQKLNEEQIKPVLDTEGAVLVIAGAGSGKTRVLTTRIAHLVANLNVKPEEILAITFTNKAADEMKERLTKILDSVSGMWVSTIHSMCVKILRQNAYYLGYDKYFTIYDETDKEKVLKRIFTSLGLEQDKFLKSFKNLISSAKNDCLDPDEFALENKHMNYINQFVSVYKEYEKELARSNSMDFDDLLCKTYKLFLYNTEIAESYARQFKYVHIDEFQDTNTVQFNLAKILSSYYNNLFVVGDDDQSIYSWRGAKIENILEFDKNFKNAKVYKLERNYRSTKKILDLANCIILNNTGRRGKELWTDKTAGTGIETFVGGDENAEASYVSMQIKSLVQRGYSYSDFAVFMRLNAISRAFEQEFMKYGIPYKVYGGFRFFERKEIKDLLSYLKIINNVKDDESFIRAATTPKRGIGDKTLLTLKEFAVSKNCSIFEVIDYGLESGLSSGTLSKLVNFKNMLISFKEFEKENGILKVLNYIIDSTAFLL